MKRQKIALLGNQKSLAEVPFTIQTAGGIDSFIWAGNPTVNYNTETYLIIGERNDASGAYRAIIHPDLSSIPAGAVNISMALQLYSYSDKSSNARTINVYRLKVANTLSQVTWNVRVTGTEWTAAGGFNAADCEQTPIGSLSLSATEAAGFKSIPLTPTTKSGLDLGFGWLVKMDTETDDAYVYYSSEDTTESNRPKLTGSYFI
jgi:hypothetical protein